jgi:hypothetical protein
MVSEMTACDGLYNEVVRHLGGDASLKELGARIVAEDNGHISLGLLHPNPRGVRSVIITARGNGFFDMDCFGHMRLGSLQADRVGRAEDIVPDSLASVLGMMTGVETLHHRHF